MKPDTSQGQVVGANPNGSAYIYNSLKLWLSCLIELGLLLPVWLVAQAYLLGPGMAAWLCGLPLLSLGGVLLRNRLRMLWQRWAVALLLGAAMALVAAWAGAGAGSGAGDWTGMWSGVVAGANANASVGTSAGTVAIAVAGSDADPGSGADPVNASMVLTFTILRASFWFAAGAFCWLQGVTAALRIGNFRLYWSGVALYFAAGIAFPRIPGLEGTVPLLTWSGAACLALALFVTNNSLLRYSSLSGDPAERLPGGLKRHNRLFIGVIVIVSLALAAGAGGWLGRLLWGLLKTFVRWLARPGEQGPPPEQAVELPPMQPMLPAAEAHEPGIWARLLDIAFYSIGILALAAALGFGLYWLYRNAGGVWRRAIDRLLDLLRREKAVQENAAYRDEEIRIFTWEAALKKWKKAGSALFRSGKAERWEDLRDNRERVRYLYRRLLKAEREGGYRIKPHLTPYETALDIRQERGLKAVRGKAAGKVKEKAEKSGYASKLAAAAAEAEAAKAAREAMFAKPKQAAQTADRPGLPESLEPAAANGPGPAEPQAAAVTKELQNTEQGLLVRLYYKVRYGEETPQDDEVAEVRRQLP
ncbi:hypothetical protein EHV15_11970 [Paenibacillus oralis]|uniref:DUF4129 domain-containing protein n=1 Tax=Paenibacillus oralis TaxID=2490856 RepID=A0A3P3TZL9_9BACL|nr:hypothetical protein [Paenibacillus oralis]RRJ63561.1 hypothetical protein EHV15_11970 [Paenibacillus oralis]